MVALKPGVLLLLGLLILNLCLTTHANVSTNYLDETRELVIVAVASLPNGTYTGASAKLTVRVVCPGGGRVYVETLPLSQIDLQASTRIAAIVASRVAGVRFYSCDFLASIRADSPIVGGPSASAATAVAFSAALLGLPLRSDVVLTGMIFPDGTIGPVGGLKAKLEAAARLGVKFFLVPYGQTEYTETVVVPQTIGPITVYTTKTVTVNLVDYGRKLGVEVLPVATIHEALYVFTDGAYSPPKTVDISLASAYITPEIEQQVKNWSKILLNMVEESRVLGNSIKEKVLSSLSRTLRAYVEPLVDDLESKTSLLIAQAEDLYKQGYLYSAASTYFQALTYSLWRLYLLRGLQSAEDLNTIRNSVERRASNVLQKVRNDLAKSGTICLQNLDVYTAVLNRVYEALLYLNRTLTESRIDRLTYYLALSDSRITTAELWSSLLEAGLPGGGMCCSLSTKYIEDSTFVVENLVHNIYTYIISFESQVAVYADTFNEMVARMNLMKNAAAPIDRLSLGVEALAYGYATLVTMFSQNINSTLAALNKAIGVELESEPLKKCLPTSLILYLELAATKDESAISRAYILARVSAMISFYVDSLREGGIAEDKLRAESTTPLNRDQSIVIQTTTRVVTLTVNVLDRQVEPSVRVTYIGIGMLLGTFIALTVMLVLRKASVSRNQVKPLLD
ncbi:MAG: S16 family serine protease [Sulfolobales archaeon]